jgi:hypothetical protein
MCCEAHPRAGWTAYSRLPHTASAWAVACFRPLYESDRCGSLCDRGYVHWCRLHFADSTMDTGASLEHVDNGFRSFPHDSVYADRVARGRPQTRSDENEHLSRKVDTVRLGK